MNIQIKNYVRPNLLHVAVLLISVSAWAGEAPRKKTLPKHDVKLFVSPSLEVAPGQTGFIQAAIQNTGSVPIRFKRYDSTNSIGGGGYDFNDPGLAIGTFGLTLDPATGEQVAWGHTDPIVLKPFSCCFGEPDFSNLNKVIIHPGELLVFDLLSFWFPPNVPLGRTSRVTIAIQIDFGKPLYLGFDSDNFSVVITASDHTANGPLQEVSLTPFSFAP
jgi:hypothetical protein